MYYRPYHIDNKNKAFFITFIFGMESPESFLDLKNHILTPNCSAIFAISFESVETTIDVNKFESIACSIV